ncbi:hypothetical protein N8I77_002246 [Diaporthe amygdali]|uniref:RlpA-like protein double-psi beta-barrel domain-containing protein n=1 Tax=Phomopsis amygdali TaxID=1214568 RepID=A0AAD9WB23_PHOAM|nr:hypothetical protein N8I77_002246 [Diaporthe amygdali]
MLFITKMISILTILMATTLGAAAAAEASTSVDTALAPAHVGDMTYYDPSQSGNEVACGGKYGPNDRIAAVGAGVFDHRAVCGKTTTVSYNGKSVTATIVDLCDGCKNDDIDVTPVVLEELAPTPSGRIPGVAWDLS